MITEKTALVITIPSDLKKVIIGDELLDNYSNENLVAIVMSEKEFKKILSIINSINSKKTKNEGFCNG